MAYYLDTCTKSMWNKVTLEEFELNDEAFDLLFRVLVDSDKVAENEVEELKRSLGEVGIDLSEVKVLDESARTLQTPVVHIIKNCNSACRICDCWMTKSPLLLSADKLRHFWGEIRRCGAQSVMVSGGEPLLHPQLTDIIDDIHENGLHVELNTNAILLDRIRPKALIDGDALIVSIDGFDSVAYKSIRGVDAFDRVSSNITAFSKQNPAVLVGIRCTLTTKVLGHLDECVEFASSNGIDVVSFSPLDSTSSSFGRDMNDRRRAELEADLLPSIEEVHEYLCDFMRGGPLANLVNESYAVGLFSWNVSDFVRCLTFYEGLLSSKMVGELANDAACSFPKTSLVVDYDGSVRPCFYSSSEYDIESFSSAEWNPVSFCKKAVARGACSGCRGKVFCGA